MSRTKHGNECKCAYCGNKEFDIPEEIIKAIEEGNLVLFAGAGISTEGKNVYKFSLYSDVNDELKEKNDNTFPQLMTKYCNLPNGRRKLINKIMERFEYYKSFPEIDNHMNTFFKPLADIYSVNEIITTNWDRQFEEKCNCMPIIYDQDISVMGDKKRKVYKIHGSIENIGTLIMTESDYEKCYKELSTNLLGSRIKYLLSNKTVVFIGYSLEDEDFKKIWNYIDNVLENLKPHFYIVSPDESMQEKMKEKNVSVINTIGSEFIEKIRQKLIENKFLLDSRILYSVAEAALNLALETHSKTCKKYKENKESLIMYSLPFQDGVIHSLQRIIARKNTGEYLNPNYLLSSIETYYNMFEDYIKNNNIIDAAYVLGYAHAMDTTFYMYNCMYFNEEPEEKNIISLYYLPTNKLYNKIDDFIEGLKKFKIKKYIKFIKELEERFGGSNSKLDIHHPPFL